MYPEIILSVVAIAWSGMILGISFLANLIKFKTPTLKKEIAFDVGRTVRSFHQVQLFLLLILLFAAFMSYFLTRYWIFLLSVTIILMIQVFVLYPRLNKRVTSMLSGTVPPSSWYNTFYNILEIIKLVVLLFFGIMIVRSLCSLE